MGRRLISIHKHKLILLLEKHMASPPATKLTFSQRYTNFEQENKHVICYVYAFLAAICFTTVNFFVKKLSHLSTAEILFYRSIQLYLMTMLMMESGKMDYYFKDFKINRLLISRGMVGVIAISLNFYGIKMVPLSEASVISQCTPVIVGIFAAIFLKEKYEKSQFFGALFCLVGVMLVAKPAFLFGVDEDKEVESYQKFVGVAALLIGTVFVATTQVLVKTVGAKTNEGVVTLYFAFTTCIFSPVLALYQGFGPFTFGDFVNIMLLGGFAFVGQIARNKAYILGNPGKIAMIAYFGIIYSMFLDVYVLGSTLDTYSVLGAVCIFSTLFVFLYKIYQQEKQKQKK